LLHDFLVRRALDQDARAVVMRAAAPTRILVLAMASPKLSLPWRNRTQYVL